MGRPAPSPDYPPHQLPRTGRTLRLSPGADGNRIPTYCHGARPAQPLRTPPPHVEVPPPVRHRGSIRQGHLLAQEHPSSPTPSIVSNWPPSRRDPRGGLEAHLHDQARPVPGTPRRGSGGRPRASSRHRAARDNHHPPPIQARVRDLQCPLGEKVSLPDHLRRRSRRPAVTDRTPDSGHFAERKPCSLKLQSPNVF